MLCTWLYRNFYQKERQLPRGLNVGLGGWGWGGVGGGSCVTEADEWTERLQQCSFRDNIMKIFLFTWTPDDEDSQYSSFCSFLFFLPTVFDSVFTNDSMSLKIKNKHGIMFKPSQSAMKINADREIICNNFSPCKWTILEINRVVFNYKNTCSLLFKINSCFI